MHLRTKRQLDDPVHGRRECAQLVTGVSVPVVHDQVGAGLPGQLGLVRAADCRCDPGAEELRQLDGEVPDRAGSASDQDGLAAHGAVGDEAAVRCHRRHAQAGAKLVGRSVRERYCLP